MNDYPKIQQFRIWSPEERKYYYSGGTPSMLSGFFSQTAILHTVHKMPYERSTFLLDKNGKEIYEGDVLQPVDSDVSRAVVEWEVNMWVRRWLPVDGGDVFTISMTQTEENFEIIGNVYENPELLTP